MGRVTPRELANKFLGWRKGWKDQKMAESRGMEQVRSSRQYALWNPSSEYAGEFRPYTSDLWHVDVPLFPAISHSVNKTKENLNPSQHGCMEEEAKQLYSSLLHC